MNISDEAVEAAARVQYDSDPVHKARWVNLSMGYKRELMVTARAALEAALPIIAARTWDEGYAHGYRHGKEDCERLYHGISDQGEANSSGGGE